MWIKQINVIRIHEDKTKVFRSFEAHMESRSVYMLNHARAILPHYQSNIKHNWETLDIIINPGTGTPRTQEAAVSQSLPPQALNNRRESWMQRFIDRFPRCLQAAATINAWTTTTPGPAQGKEGIDKPLRPDTTRRYNRDVVWQKQPCINAKRTGTATQETPGRDHMYVTPYGRPYV